MMQLLCSNGLGHGPLAEVPLRPGIATALHAPASLQYPRGAEGKRLLATALAHCADC